MSPAARVRALSSTPVKGLRLQARQAVDLDVDGVSDNRRFYLIDERDRMVNAKQIGLLSSVDAEYEEGDDVLTLAFPDGTAVTGVVTIGDPVATSFFSRRRTASLVSGPWAEVLSAYTGHRLRLVMAPAGATAVDRGRGGAVSLISRASVEHLEQVAAAEVDARRFRMLVEVDGVQAHAEDAWVGRRIRLGGAVVLIRGHVGRCLVTGRDPDTGVPDLPTLDLLRSYRDGLDTTEPLPFGVYGAVVSPGRVQLGDPVGLVDG